MGIGLCYELLAVEAVAGSKTARYLTLSVVNLFPGTAVCLRASETRCQSRHCLVFSDGVTNRIAMKNDLFI